MDKQNTKVLIVDDDPFIRDMLAAILESSGYSVDTAENGAEALKKYNPDAGISLIISDMNMPEMDGLELIKKIRGSGSDVPIIILTGNNEISVAIDAMNSGASDYLLKDENIQDTIILSAKKVLEKDQLKRQNLRLMADLAVKNEKFEKERIFASKVQKNILPNKIDFKNFDIRTFYRPSDSLGGDFYDAWETGRTLHFVVGDVSGHGIAAALLMAASKGMLNSLGQTMHTQQEVITATNRMLCDILGDSGMFLSLVYITFMKQKNEIQVLSAGHNPIFIMRGGEVRIIKSTGPVMGWDYDDYWEIERYPFNSGDSIFIYTDGLTEARNAKGDEFGENHLQKLISRIKQDNAFVDNIFKEVSDFCSGIFFDDVTMFAIRRFGDE